MLALTHRFVPYALGAALVLGAGCGEAAERISESATERAIEQAGGGDVDIDLDDDTGGFKVETEDGSFSLGSGEIPDSWPDDVPLPELSDVSASEIKDAASGLLMTVTGTTSLSADATEAFFADGLSGWTESSRMSFGGDANESVQVGYEQGERQLLVSVVDDGESVFLTLTLTENA